MGYVSRRLQRLRNVDTDRLGGREIDKSTKVIADGSNAQDQGACHVLERVCLMSSQTLFALTTFDDLQCLLIVTKCSMFGSDFCIKHAGYFKNTSL